MSIDQVDGSLGQLVHLGKDGLEALAVVDSLQKQCRLLGVEVAVDGLAGNRGAPVPVRAVELRGVGVAVAGGGAAAAGALRYRALEDEANLRDLEGELAVAAL